jgi:hypothetical protein
LKVQFRKERFVRYKMDNDGCKSVCKRRNARTEWQPSTGRPRVTQKQGGPRNHETQLVSYYNLALTHYYKIKNLRIKHIVSIIKLFKNFLRIFMYKFYHFESIITLIVITRNRLQLYCRHNSSQKITVRLRFHLILIQPIV